MARTTIRKGDSYTDKLGKLLPAEMVALYIALYTVIEGVTGSQALTLGWIVFGLALVVTIAYLIYQNSKNPDSEKRKWWEILASIFSFAVWGLTVKGLGRQTFGWTQVLENLVVVAWTMIPPYFIPGT